MSIPAPGALPDGARAERVEYRKPASGARDSGRAPPGATNRSEQHVPDERLNDRHCPDAWKKVFAARRIEHEQDARNLQRPRPAAKRAVWSAERGCDDEHGFDDDGQRRYLPGFHLMPQPTLGR